MHQNPDGTLPFRGQLELRKLRVLVTFTNGQEVFWPEADETVAVDCIGQTAVCSVDPPDGTGFRIFTPNPLRRGRHRINILVENMGLMFLKYGRQTLNAKNVRRHTRAHGYAEMLRPNTKTVMARSFQLTSQHEGTVHIQTMHQESPCAARIDFCYQEPDVISVNTCDPDPDWLAPVIPLFEAA